jgi:hypothetical protein
MPTTITRVELLDVRFPASAGRHGAAFAVPLVCYAYVLFFSTIRGHAARRERSTVALY